MLVIFVKINTLHSNFITAYSVESVGIKNREQSISQNYVVITNITTRIKGKL